MTRPLIYNAFVMNTASHITHGLWRHPETRQRDFNQLDVWTDLAKLLERGRFDALFLADVVGLYGNYRGGWETYVREGLQIPSNDPSVLISALAGVTENLGLAFTSSVIQAHPFEFARRISTLDHLTNGRVGWNIVTNFQENAHRNFGIDGLTEHDERYRHGEEYVEVAYKLWEGSWEDDALLRDVTGSYSDPSKIHKINHAGERYSVEGPHLPSPSPQRTPVLYQAGASAAGRAFAARHAEGVFTMAADRETVRSIVQDLRRQAVAAGRHADDLKVLQGLTFVVGSTEEEAWRRDAELDQYLSIDGMLAHMSGAMGLDLGFSEHDEPLTELAERVPGVQSIVQGVIDAAPKGTRATVGDLARVNARATRVTGTPEQIADEIELWHEAGVDGFNVMYAITPGSFEDFIDHVLPVLRDRGLAQREYGPGSTLRERLFPGNGPRLPDRHPATKQRAIWEYGPTALDTAVATR
ncbi:MAG: LLM class flavin-dependent oxidoreductase [Solirubrobacterales bacterium]|nr:LLM class flavin-dependent oxidoreductase [Solirubrobacterales bacterium]